MSIPNATISCVGCQEAYDAGTHQPQVLDCGHGTCKSCVVTTPICQQCHYVVQAPIPNFELLDQMDRHSTSFSESVVKTTKNYQDLAKSLDEEISKVDHWLNDIKDDFVDLIAADIVDESTELEPKAEELVTLGLFQDLVEAKSALSAKVKKISQDKAKLASEVISREEQREISIAAAKLATSARVDENEVERCAAKLGISKERLEDAIGKRLLDLYPSRRGGNKGWHKAAKPLKPSDVAKLVKTMHLSAELFSENGEVGRKVIANDAKQAGYANDLRFRAFQAKKGNRKIPRYIKALLLEKAAITAKQKANGSKAPNVSDMSEIGHVSSCSICMESYTAVGRHKPLVFNCGHGSCMSCVKQLQKHAKKKSIACHQCRKPIGSTLVNKDLVAQIKLDDKALSERFKGHQSVIDFKKNYLSQSKEKFNALRAEYKRRTRKQPESSSSTTSSSSSSTSNSSESVPSSASSSTFSTSTYTWFVNAVWEVGDMFCSWWNQTAAPTTTASTTYLPSSARTALHLEQS